MYPETGAAQAEQHLFTEEDLNQYQEASTGQRFLNLLIDVLVMRFGLSLITTELVGQVLVNYFPEFTMRLLYKGFEYYLAIYIVGFVNVVSYYTICEGLFRGHTLGKLVTGTKAIRENGDPLRFTDALLRSLCRLVPFEWFSGFGYRPWHDKWTRTIVIKTR